MDENVVNNEVKETPAVSTTPEQTKAVPTDSGAVAKETSIAQPSSTVPYSRFSEVISQKNEAIKKAQELETRYRELEQRSRPPQTEHDPFSELPPDERKQTEDFINKFVSPKVRSDVLKEFAPFIQEVQNEKLNKQINEAKDFAGKAGINFDERLPEIVDFLSRPENKGRLTAKEALFSLYNDEFLSNAQNRGKEEVSREQKELMEKKKLANTQLSSVNPQVVVQSDEMARRALSPQERLSYDINKAMEMTKQGVKNPKVRA